MRKHGSLKKDYRNVAKLRDGPGGWYCTCCNPFNCSPRKMKIKARRIYRHVMKREILKEVE